MTILIIEDEPAIRELMRLVLTRQAHEVLVANGPEAAQSLWRQELSRIDLVVCDVNLGSQDGTNLCEKFRTEKPATRVILCSGSSYLDTTAATRVWILNGLARVSNLENPGPP